MEIKKRAIKSLTIVSIGHILIKTIDAVKNIVLARLLFPEDFGVVAIALFLTEFLRQISQSGFNAAVIQKSEIDDRTIYTGFTFSLLSTIIVIVIAWLSADFYEGFYDNDQIDAVVKVISISFIVLSIGFVPGTILTRQLDFNKIVLSELLALIFSALLAIFMAYLGFGFWSLVSGIIARMTLNQLFLFLVKPLKLRLVFDFVVAKKLFSFGLKVLITTILAFIANKIPVAIIGNILGVTVLGYFALAFRWGYFVSSDVTQVLAKVLFPTFSLIQNEPQKIKSGYLKTLKYLSLMIFPCSFGVAAIAPEFVIVVFGEKWNLAVVPLQILCFSGLFRALRLIGGEARKAVGRPDITNNALVAQLVILLTLLVLLAHLIGLVGACLAVLIATMLITITLIHIDRKMFNFKIKEIIAILKHPFLGSSFMVLCIVTARILLKGADETLLLFVLIVTGIIAYFIYTYLASPELITNFLKSHSIE